MKKIPFGATPCLKQIGKANQFAAKISDTPGKALAGDESLINHIKAAFNA